MNEQAIFLAALEKDPAERAAFLDEACGGHDTLRRGVETLLRLHREDSGFLDVPAIDQLAAAQPRPGDAVAELSFLAPPSEPGTLGRLDHYEILEVVGRGGMGVVLRARDVKLLRVVAIKVLAGALAASGSARQRFVREARAAAAVRDDHVVAIHAVCDDGPVPYLVMEFIDGDNLEALVRRDGPLEIKEVLRIGIQVAGGLAAAHRQGLIHRDVKPANVLLENGVQRVKLTDFGLARAADDASMTQSGFVAGTPLYMSPEQARGGPIDARADLFSLGSVLYELCAGRPAFRAETSLAVMKRVCEETPRPIREVNPNVPEPLARLIDRLHAKRPADRPATARAVADLLAGLLATLQGQAPAHPSGTAPPPEPRRSSRPWLWAAAALLVLVAGLGLGEASGVTKVRGTVVRLFSPEGTLVVEVDDPDVSVTVDGSDLVITGAGAKEIRLKPGKYTVQASKDGKVVRRELVTVEKNDRRVVRVSLEPAPPRDAKADKVEAAEWERSVAALPAHEQAAAVAARLKDRNPGFDGKMKHVIERNVVTGVVVGQDMVDLSPLRTLVGLKSLEVNQPFAARKVWDLSPLKGMRLTSLAFSHTHVSDLSPLEGMPLTSLYLAKSPVTDLSPLRGMKLTEFRCVQTKVADLSPLEGMPLTSLYLADSPVADLSPLKGNKTLTTLDLYMTHVIDLSALKGVPLTSLNLGRTGVTDLSPLRGMKLTSLVLKDTAVSDLSPLEGMPLTSLNCHYSHVADLSPLKGTKLTELDCSKAKVTDLSPLAGLPLKTLTCDFEAERDAKILRAIRTLQTINGKPAAEFWKAVDAKSKD